MVDATYRNKKNGRVATVIQEDAKSRTVLVRYEDTDDEQQISFSTLKRWWEEIEDDEDFDDEELDEDDVDDDEEEDYDDDDDEEYDDEDLEEDEDPEDEDEEEADEDPDEEEDDDEEEEDDLAGDGTPLNEVGKEIAAQAKKKAETAKKSAAKNAPAKKDAGAAKGRTKVDRTPVIKEIRAAAEKIGFGWKEYEKVSNFAVLTVSDHLKASVRFGSSKLSINVKEDIAQESGLNYRKMVYFLPAVVDFEYSGSLKSDIKPLLTLVYKSASDSKKTDKKAAKKAAK